MAQYKRLTSHVDMKVEKKIEDLESVQAELQQELVAVADLSNQHSDNLSPFLRILQMMGHAVFVFSPTTGELMFWNRSAEDLYGWKDYEVLGKHALKLLIPKSEYALAETILGRISMGQAWAGLFPLMKKSGRVFTAMITDTPLYENGEVVGVISVTSDAFAYGDISSTGVSSYNSFAGQTQNMSDNFQVIYHFDKQTFEQRLPLRKVSTISKLAKRMLACIGTGENNVDLYSADEYYGGWGEELVPAEVLTRPAVKKLSKICVGVNSSNILARCRNDVGSYRVNGNAWIPTKQDSKMLSKFLYGGTDSTLSRASYVQERLDRGSEHVNPSPYQDSNIYLRTKQDGQLHFEDDVRFVEKDTLHSRKSQENDFHRVLKTASNCLKNSAEISSRQFPIILPQSSSNEIELEDKGLEKMSKNRAIPEDWNNREYYWKRFGWDKHLNGILESSSTRKHLGRNWLVYDDHSSENIQRDKWPLQRSEINKEIEQPAQKLIIEKNNRAKITQNNIEAAEAPVSQNITDSNNRLFLFERGEVGLDSIADSVLLWEDLFLGKPIGKGSCGVVYNGSWHGLDVAIKAFSGYDYSDEILQGCDKEVSVMKRLSYPNVVVFIGAVYAPKRFAIVTELLPRGSLFKILHNNTHKLELKHRLRMALDVARGMNYLHHQNPPIIHQDLKSSNLLVDENWMVKVGDFGLSKLKNATCLTRVTGKGMPQWMSPEVLRNESSNKKSDVYSFGVILWELAMSQIPWKNFNALQVVGMVGFKDCRLEIPEGLDPKVAALICDCWHSDPVQRPSFNNIVEKMEELLRLEHTFGDD